LAAAGAPQTNVAGDVASIDNEGWSLYGAPWLQPVATGRKSDGLKNRKNKRKPLLWVCDRCRQKW